MIAMQNTGENEHMFGHDCNRPRFKDNTPVTKWA